MRRTLRPILTAIGTALLLAACAPADPVAEAIAAGNDLNATYQTCIDHMKAQQGDTGVPECNAMLQQATYSKAKAKVTTPSIALDAIDEKSLLLRQEAGQLLPPPPQLQ